MKNSKQPINPTTYTRVGNEEDDFEPLVEGKKTGYERQFGGLTKREYFAGLAMQGLCADLKPQNSDTILDLPKNVASWSVAFADKLLEELEKEIKSNN